MLLLFLWVHHRNGANKYMDKRQYTLCLMHCKSNARRCMQNVETLLLFLRALQERCEKIWDKRQRTLCWLHSRSDMRIYDKFWWPLFWRALCKMRGDRWYSINLVFVFLKALWERCEDNIGWESVNMIWVYGRNNARRCVMSISECFLMSAS